MCKNKEDFYVSLHKKFEEYNKSKWSLAKNIYEFNNILEIESLDKEEFDLFLVKTCGVSLQEGKRMLLMYKTTEKKPLVLREWLRSIPWGIMEQVLDIATVYNHESIWDDIKDLDMDAIKEYVVEYKESW